MPRRILAIALAAAALGGCSHSLPTIDGAPSAPPAPNQAWRVPRNAVPPEPVQPPPPGLPADIAPRANTLALSDIVDIALRNNPQTRLSWAQARAGAEFYGAAKTSVIPIIDATSLLARTQTTSQVGSATRSTLVPAISLTYLVLDFGGRSGTIASARAAAMAFDLEHNATLQNVALQAEAAYFTYQGQQSLVIGARETVAEADSNLAAARERNRAGVATIADVLQAETQLAQSQLDLETAEGALQTARGSLALAMGLTANARFGLVPAPDTMTVSMVSTQVDTLIDRALELRPDLAALRASILQAQAEVRIAKSLALPAVTFGTNYGRTLSEVSTFRGLNYGVTFSIQIPIFNMARPYNVAGAEALVTAATARAELLRTEVAQQVYNSYYLLQTATRRSRTADVLLASATRSEETARERYRAGVGTILDLITAQTFLASARAQQSQARWTWGFALAQLSHDVGVLGPRGDALPSGADALGVRR